MTTKHTPGPWKQHGLAVYTKRKLPSQSYPGDPQDRWVASAQWDDEEENKERTWNADEAEANARLIAAAPELLQMLRGCADALAEAGKSFELHNPLAARPNLYELHEREARALSRRIDGED